MDLGAYAQIEDLEGIMKENGIEVQRLRGLRLMKDEKAYSQKEIDDVAKTIGLIFCESACESRFVYDPIMFECSKETSKLKKKYLFYRETEEGYCECVGINWEKVHGKARKAFKRAIRFSKRDVNQNLKTFNKYCGRDDVLYIHARIGGLNWDHFGGPEIAKQPWFLEKVDDYFDSTYCDIYVKIKQKE